jgi:hypothetical protein
MTGLSSVESVMTLPDATPPEPNPMTWAHPPGEQNGFDSIVMEATTAVDPCGVEYYFECVSGNCYDSGWQDSPFYEDWPLDANSQYTYRVQARDKSPARNATDWSVEVSTSTEPHCPPVFNIMHVESIVCETVSVGGGDKAGRVTVTILDDCGNPASDVRVVGTFSGDFNEQQGANTTSSGSAVFTSHREVKSPSYTFCIDLVLDHNNTYTYDERYNVEICDSY